MWIFGSTKIMALYNLVCSIKIIDLLGLLSHYRTTLWKLWFWGGEVNWGEIRQAGIILVGGVFSSLHRFRKFFICFKCMRNYYLKKFRILITMYLQV